MTRHAARALAIALLLPACARVSRLVTPAPERTWTATLAAAQAAADSGNYASADRWLSSFDARHPTADEAHESVYWRALFRLAPGNDSTARQLAIPTLERYLARPGGRFRTEAKTLLALEQQRAAAEEESAAKEKEIAQIRAALGRAERASAAPATGTGGGNDASADRSLAGEVERLRRELTAANAELERIRKRLAGERP